MNQVFNELSASGSYVDPYRANTGMESLVNISIELERIGYSSKLFVVENFAQLSLSPEYTIHHWIIERTVPVNRDLQRWLLTKATQSPYVENILDEKQIDRILEFRYDGKLCYGLGLAYLDGCVALSLNGDQRFEKSEVEIEFFEILDDRESKNFVSVSSIFTDHQLEEFETALNSKIIKKIINGNLLIEYLPILFPNLSISDKAEDQLNSLSGSEPYFAGILKHLSALNKEMSYWCGGSFDPKGIDWSPESETTLQKYSSDRTFYCKDGNFRVFSLHSKIHGPNQRIYFYPASEHKVVHIGYVGKHLRTTRHKT